LQFIGGEPLIRNDFHDIADFMKERKIYFGIITNGTMLDRDMSRLLTNECLRSIIISLDGPDAETHNTIRGEGVFEKVVSNIELFNNYRQNHNECRTTLSINFVPTALNYQKIAEMIRFCDTRRVTNLSILEFFDDGNAKGKNMGVPDDKAIDFLLDTARTLNDGYPHINVVPGFIHPLALDYLHQCHGLNFPPVAHLCGAGVNFAFLDNAGKIYPCNRNRDHETVTTSNSLLEKEFRDIWINDDYNEPFSNYMNPKSYSELEPCNKCRHLFHACLPCYLSLRHKRDTMFKECWRYIDAAEKMGVKLLNDQSFESLQNRQGTR
jgi:radical SAM protein with 4Fe4S-binding SPASM domain